MAEQWKPEDHAPDTEPERSLWLWLVDYLFKEWADSRPALWEQVEASAWDILKKITSDTMIVKR